MANLDQDLLKFFRQLKSEVTDESFDEDHGGMRLRAFGKVLLDRFEEAGFVESGQRAYFMKAMPRGNPEVHAYAVDADDDLLSLFMFLEYDGDEPATIPKADIEAAYRRMQLFAKLATGGQLDNSIEPSQDAHELICLLKEGAKLKRRTLFSVITNGLMSDRATGSVDDEDKDTWDVLRLFRSFGSSIVREPINVNFVHDYGGQLPCLVTPPAKDGLQVYLTRIRGDVLAKLYDRYRSRLLERNVRSFLQFTGKVNKGIRETIISQPDRFLPYNNGISATAALVSTQSTTDGLAYINSVEDFQIVNGGQTTASLASAARRDDIDLSPIFVQMKLTIIPPEKLDEIVPLISQFANTQNRVQEADFKANHPHHIALEKLSREIWTRPTDTTPRGTRWFYERSRGQYAVEKLRFPDAGKRRFAQENPPAQKFSKTDLAKYLMSWDQCPQIVSLGAQKNFLYYMSLVGRENRPLPDEPEYKRIITIAMLFKRAEKLYGELDFIGYRANVVAYTLGMLSYRVKKYLDWDELWQMGAVPDAIVEMMRPLMITARNIILNPSGQQNITEWCKKEACWMAVLQANTEEIPGLPTQLPPSEIPIHESDKKLVEAVTFVPAAVWFDLSKWAKQTENLQSWQRSMAFNIGKKIASDARPSVKLAKQGPKIIEDAWNAGFRHEKLDATAIARLKSLEQQD